MFIIFTVDEPLLTPFSFLFEFRFACGIHQNIHEFSVSTLLMDNQVTYRLLNASICKVWLLLMLMPQ